MSFLFFFIYVCNDVKKEHREDTVPMSFLFFFIYDL